ncbi:serine/threonine-protein kinase [Nocardia goodfellowii]|uniref:non-specific serine/threonine protein kinase n=1 Tax=Nocardia goodfellowii TaxID=882446 RepID=A0ABS4QH27_9NOCA|nr:serine/threonine-protein kinase [Nocardia goodfellowii]MBP2190960.1 serine/threonine-protein kinase [Nocardia goodfellowii]
MLGNLRPGTVFAGYLIERVLGGGGMGTVYVARHPRLPRREALKVLAPEHSADAEFRARFIREAELTARLNHPNIVAVHDRGVTEDRLWIAMQFVDGVDAAALVGNGSGLPPHRALHIIEQAARGLDEAHRAGMVHRDVKPANILIEARDGDADRVLVTDFGIGWAASESTALTEAGSVLATLAYAAPEQLRALTVDHRADVYALGGTLYELLTGSRPFPRPTPAAVIQAHLQDPPPRPTERNPGLPQAIDAVLARAMAKNPAERYESCGALAGAAASAFGLRTPQPVPRFPVPPPSRGHAKLGSGHAKLGSGRAKFGIGLAVLALVVVLGITGAVALNRDSGVRSAPSATSAAPTTSPPPTTTTATGNWGSHSYIARAFPGLLPANPDTGGYQNMRCAAIDAERRPVDLTAPAQGENRLSCNGNKDPVHVLVAVCNSDRGKEKSAVVRSEEAVVGDQAWTRFSGSGRIVWSDITDPRGGPAGALSILFDDLGRDFCQILVYGGTSGQDLMDRWWSSAPI